MWQTLIAVLGTLAGTGVAGLLQHRAARATRTEARRTAAIEAVSDLVGALAEHRRAMWVREDQRLAGADWTGARAASHATRAAITAPLVRVQVLLPTLAPAATAAADAAYGLREAISRDVLQAARAAAIRACDDLIAAASRDLNWHHCPDERGL